MAAGNKFNATAAAVYNGAVNLGSDTVKFMLTNTAPTSANSVYSDISGTELAGTNGYTTGGFAATLISSSQISGTYRYIISLPSPTLTATGSVGPFRYIVAYDSSASVKTLLGWWDNGTSITLSSGNTFTISPDATNGLIQNS